MPSAGNILGNWCKLLRRLLLIFWSKRDAIKGNPELKFVLDAWSQLRPLNPIGKIVLDIFETILRNAGIEDYEEMDKGVGINVITNEKEHMHNLGIIDPVLVTKTALKNAISVVSTIISANCVISNIRVNESS